MDWGAFLSAFGLILIAEFGDKTQLAVVTQTCKHGRPWAVFAGASTGLIAVTALGAIGGQVLKRLIPQGVLRIVAGLAFVGMGVLVAREARGTEDSRSSGEPCNNPGDASRDSASNSAWDWGAFSSTLGLLFVAELGDKTQLAVLTLSSNHGDAWAVFLGGALALTLVTAIGAAGGRLLSALVRPRTLWWASAGAFITLGALMVAGLP
jgi:putative Ca2+/H+ antiporter (TMEM165/GDT1 family)